MQEELLKTDILGTEICKGNLVAYSRSGRNTKELKIAIVSRVVPTKKGGRVYFFEKRLIVDRKTYLKLGEDVSENVCHTLLSTDVYQQHLVVINNPYFLLENPKIAEQNKIADLAIDQGFLPKDYYLGMSVKPSVVEDLKAEMIEILS